MKKKRIWISSIIVIVVGILVYAIYHQVSAPANKLKDKYKEDRDISASIDEVEDQYDVIVIGGEPEGVAAAVSAARNGANTLLVEKREELGGLFTYGMLNFLDIPQGENGKSVSKGIFEEWHEMVGGQSSFGIEEAKAAFKQLVDEEPNLSLLTETEVVKSIVENNQVTAVVLKNKQGEKTIQGKTFIDATQDADFAVMSKVPYFVGGEDIGIQDKKMAVTLMIHLKNVDWDKVKQTAKSKKFGEAEVNKRGAWGFSELHYAYKPVEENTRLRGLNIAKIDDEYYINALQIFGVDGLDEQSKQEAIEKGKRETKHILQFLKNEFPGFEQAEIASFPTELYVRETRHIWSEYQLPMADVWTNRDSWDTIAYGGYPVDIQAQTPQDYGYVIASPKQYGIPFRSLVPQEIDGLLVVGRSSGYSSIAAGSVRVVPTGMATGEAAGAAAALAVKENISFRLMSNNESFIETLRNTLKDQGAFVDYIDTSYPYEGEWYDSSIQTLMNYGLVVGGYTNDLHVDDVATKHSFMNMIRGAFQRVNPSVDENISSRMDSIYATVLASQNTSLNKEDVTKILSEIFFENASSANWDALIDEGIIQSSVDEQIDEKNHELTMKEMYGIAASVIDYLQEGNNGFKY